MEFHINRNLNGVDLLLQSPWFQNRVAPSRANTLRPRHVSLNQPNGASIKHR